MSEARRLRVTGIIPESLPDPSAAKWRWRWKRRWKMSEYMICAPCVSDECEHVLSPDESTSRWGIEIELTKRWRFAVLAETEDEARQAARDVDVESWYPDDEEEWMTCHPARNV